MICGVLEVENVVQVNDKTRLSAVKSFAAKGESAITKVEIEPESGNGFIDITDDRQEDWFLDWVYSGATRSVTATLRITTDSTPSTFTKTIQINSVTDDALFSSDKDLTSIEPDILKWVPDGRASWLNVHRAAQEKIMDWLNKAGVTGTDGNKLTKAAVIDVDEVRFWSRDLTLALIFKGIQNVKDDVFAEKAKFYFAEANKSTDRARIRLDVNADGVIDNADGSINLTSADLVRA